MKQSNEQMIYVHVPFCTSKCYYCNFVSFANNPFVQRYFDSLKKEIEGAKNNKVVTSIYFGGGTPSAVDSKFIEETINSIKQNFVIDKLAEITIECNPKSTTKQKLQDYCKMGFNRISFGVQSLDDNKLEKLGRFQTRKQSLDAIKMAKEVGFKNISADLLLGLEGQTQKEVQNDLKTLINVGVQHISAYMLILEEDAPIYKMVKSNKYILPTEDETVEIYNSLFNFLKKNNFERYEVSNFALPGFLSRHNLGYWQDKAYLGFGLSAHSYDKTKRWSNSSILEEYINQRGRQEEILTQNQKLEDAIMLGLRTKFGIDKNLIKNNNELDFLLKNNFVYEKEGQIIVCEDKEGVLNQIILKLI